jgi:aerobic carbon-monoxide dehydrogenase small subunit
MREPTFIRLIVNGKPEVVRTSHCDSLADVLRNSLELTATHVGCNEGVCGACTVLVDGATARSCMILAGQIHGQSVETIEGYADSPARQILQRAFVDEFAAQCGFCTPGMLAVAAEFLADPSIPDHTDEALILGRVKAVLCRCTGYRNVVAAISRAARELKVNADG